MKKGYKALLAEAEAEALAVEQALRLHGDGGVMFVDLRDPREIKRAGRILGSSHCPRGMLEFWVASESTYAKPMFAEPKRFLFYCNGLARPAAGPEPSVHSRPIWQSRC